jgi:hypothetical protein
MSENPDQTTAPSRFNVSFYQKPMEGSLLNVEAVQALAFVGIADALTRIAVALEQIAEKQAKQY